MTDTPLHRATIEDADTVIRLPKVVLPLADDPRAAAAFRRALPWRSITLQALVAWLLTRVGYVLLTAIAHGLPQRRPAQGVGFLGLWQRFDTNWYISIATQGYHSPPQIAFFPVYPALMRLASALLGGHTLVAALVVANLGALAALIGFGGLAAWELRDARAATYAIIAILIYPFSFFLAAAYTEGLFIAFTVFCLLFARQGRWRLAALMALLAGATRPTGVALVPALAWEWLRQEGLLQPEQWRALLRPGRAQVARDWLGALLVALRRRWDGVVAIAAIPAFILGLAVFSWRRFGHPSLIITVRRDYWGLIGAPIWRSLYREVANIFVAPPGSATQIILILDTLSLIAVAAIIITRWRRYPFAYALYTVALLYLCVAESTSGGLQIFQGPGRYLLGAAPMFFALGDLLEQRRWLAVALIGAGLALQVYIALQFLTGTLIE